MATVSKLELPMCVHRVLLSGGRMFCNSPECSGDPATRPAYSVKHCAGCGWDKGPHAAAKHVPPKPRMTFTQLAAVNARRARCRQLKAAGLPCPDDVANKARTNAAAPIEDDDMSRNGRPALRWAYGVTTVRSRLDDYLPRTLASLRGAGFDRPQLFVDDHGDADEITARFSLPATCRGPRIGAYGNWVMALWELYLRDPAADRYALFQDDVVAYRNLRAYLDRQPFPANGYWNLNTFPENERLCPRVGTPYPPHPGATHTVNDSARRRGFYEANQSGRSACALVFDLACVVALLSHQEPIDANHGTSAAHVVEHVRDVQRSKTFIDGAVVSAMAKARRREFVHYPTLVKHTGDVSSIGNRRFPPSVSWQGDGFDAMELIGCDSLAVPR